MKVKAYMYSLIMGYKDFFVKKPRVLPKAARGIINRAILNRQSLRVTEIAATFSCNSKCVMCSCSKLFDSDKEKKRMSINEYAALGRQLDEIGCVSVNVTGGEPLTRIDIPEVITALGPKTKIVNLITNGINLTEEKVSRYKDIGVDSIVVSLESTDAKENDTIRGYNGHFKAVSLVIGWSKKYNLNTAISLTLGDFNFDKVYELLEFAKMNSVFLCVAHAGSIGNWADNNSISLSLNNANKLLSLIKKHKCMKIDFSANLKLRPGCPAMLEKVYITPYGDILPCTFIPITFGNVREEPLKKICARMFDFHKKYIKNKSLCLRAYDKNFKDNFLYPIKDMRHPVHINKHPFFSQIKAKNNG